MRDFKMFFARLCNWLRKKWLSRIEQRVEEIMRSDLDFEVKRQKLFRLTDELGLPGFSADIVAKPLTYPELFNQLQQWISGKRADRLTRLSILVAMLAVGASVLIHWNTWQLLVPTEKPIISPIDSNCKGMLNKETGKVEITLKLVMKNVGKHPASNLRIRAWGALVDEPNDLKIVRDVTMADPLYPNISCTLPSTISVKPKMTGDELSLPKGTAFYCIRMDYRDEWFRENADTQYFHLVYEIGRGVLEGASVEVKEKFESYLRRAGAID